MNGWCCWRCRKCIFHFQTIENVAFLVKLSHLSVEFIRESADWFPQFRSFKLYSRKIREKKTNIIRWHIYFFTLFLLIFSLYCCTVQKLYMYTKLKLKLEVKAKSKKPKPQSCIINQTPFNSIKLYIHKIHETL